MRFVGRLVNCSLRDTDDEITVIRKRVVLLTLLLTAVICVTASLLQMNVLLQFPGCAPLVVGFMAAGCFVYILLTRSGTQAEVQAILIGLNVGILLLDWNAEVNYGVRFWPIFVVVADLQIICRLDWRMIVGSTVGVVCWILVTSLEDFTRFGLWDVSADDSLYDARRDAVLSCSKPPCSSSVLSSVYTCFSSVLVIVVNLLVTKSLAEKVSESEAIVKNAGRKADLVARALGMFDMELARDHLETTRAYSLPTQLRVALTRIVSIVLAIKPFIPSAVIEECMGASRIDFHQPRLEDMPATWTSTCTSSLGPPATHDTPEACIVFTDILASTKTWEAVPDAMRKALRLHNHAIRGAIEEWFGYEVKTIGDSFMVAFDDLSSGINFGLTVQEDLFTLEWPASLLGVAQCARSIDGDWNGLRVRVGVNFGEVVAEQNPLTQRFDYFGHTVNKAARLEANGIPGFVCLPSDLFAGVLPHCLKPHYVARKQCLTFKGVQGVTEVASLQSTALSKRRPADALPESLRMPSGNVAGPPEAATQPPPPPPPPPPQQHVNPFLTALDPAKKKLSAVSWPSALGDAEVGSARNGTAAAQPGQARILGSLSAVSFAPEAEDGADTSSHDGAPTPAEQQPRGARRPMHPPERLSLVLADDGSPAAAAAAKSEAAAPHGAALPADLQSTPLRAKGTGGSPAAAVSSHFGVVSPLTTLSSSERDTGYNFAQQIIQQMQRRASPAESSSNSCSSGSEASVSVIRKRLNINPLRTIALSRKGLMQHSFSTSFLLRKSAGSFRCQGEAKDAVSTAARSDMVTTACIMMRLTRAGSEPVADFVNDVIERVLQCLERSDGTLLAVVGNSILAAWNMAKPCIHHFESAIHFATILLQNHDQDHHELRVMDDCLNIGLATSSALCGSFGTDSQRFLTAMGPCVSLCWNLANTASLLNVTSLYTMPNVSKHFSWLCAEHGNKLRPVAKSRWCRTGIDGDDSVFIFQVETKPEKWGKRLIPATCDISNSTEDNPLTLFPWSNATHWNEFLAGNLDAIKSRAQENEDHTLVSILDCVGSDLFLKHQS
ncbi:Adenylate cyclase [Diplonema papillatum]|nr:Adenylate cyclase [Diplonema papillatum]